MKKAITFRLCVVIITAMVMMALLGYYLLTKSAKEAMRTNSEIRFNQVSEVLKKNDTEIAELRENLKELMAPEQKQARGLGRWKEWLKHEKKADE